jgi:hypothetical protein
LAINLSVEKFIASHYDTVLAKNEGILDGLARIPAMFYCKNTYKEFGGEWNGQTMELAQMQILKVGNQQIWHFPPIQ